ncbi:hypothetical protein [Aquiflexum sp.]|uniref:hypothetical protein n=1 Tax=Aquiflexum sp. TaxID=1872584 RepID=UPI0035947306
MSSHSLPTQTAAIEIFAFQKITKKEGAYTKDLNPLEIIESCEMVNVLETASFDFPNFPEAKKSFHVIYFELSEEFQAVKGLFNGLISLGHKDAVILDFEKDLSRYSLKFYVSQEAEVNNYLNKIFRFVSDEIRFKKILKKSIANQKAFAKEEQLLRKELFA